LYCKQNGLYFDKRINVIDNSRTYIHTIDIWYGWYQSKNILKTAASLIRKRALELYSLEDDSELRKFFDHVGGIETSINFVTLLNRQVDAWTQLFKSIDNNFVHSNTESLQVGFNGIDVNFKT
jgi:hypothetical protein